MTPRAATLLTSLAAAGLTLVLVIGHPRHPAAATLLAAAMAAALLARWGNTPRGPRRGRLVLALVLLPTLVHFHLGGGRISGDGVSYYVYVRSLVADRDLDFSNEYAHYGLLDREDIRVPTRTGLRRSIFAVGPGLLWVPFYLFGEAVARAHSLVAEVDLSGYGPHHVNAVALASLLLGFAAVVLVHDVLARHFRAGTALAAALLLWLATFLYWYMVQQPTMSHAPSTFGAALVLWMWDRGFHRGTAARALAFGLIAGLAMCLRWQNAVLLLLPAADLLREIRRGASLPLVWRDVLLRGLALGAGVLAGALPQMAAWRVLYGEWLLRHPPHGADFLRLDRPFVLETLFSSRHGLLSWTPVLWLGYLGFLPLLRRRRALALALLPVALVMTYVNMCSGDWWAGGSFSNRRFDSLLPVLAAPLAAALDALMRAAARRPRLFAAAVLTLFAATNVAVVEGVRREGLPRTGTVSLPALAAGAARAMSAGVGSPPTWPASWIFAWRSGLPREQYDLVVGRYLFYRQNNLQGEIALGQRGDEALLGEGWGPRVEIDARQARTVSSRARVIAPLDVPEDLVVEIRARRAVGNGTVGVAVNGEHAGTLAVSEAWSAPRLAVPRAWWRRDLNDVVLLTAGGTVWVDALVFTRPGAAPGEERGFRAR